jgi:hypothetical protein
MDIAFVCARLLHSLHERHEALDPHAHRDAAIGGK